MVGFGGEACVDAVESNPRITKRHLGSPPFRRCSRRWFLLYAPLKVIIQVAQLLWALLTIPRPVAYLVQNPPRCALACGRRGGGSMSAVYSAHAVTLNVHWRTLCTWVVRAASPRWRWCCTPRRAVEAAS